MSDRRQNATRKSRSARDFVETAFAFADLDCRDHVDIGPRYIRPTEVEHLQGDASKTREMLGWEPKVAFKELVEMLVESDWDLARRERALSDSGAPFVTHAGAAR